MNPRIKIMQKKINSYATLYGVEKVTRIRIKADWQ